MKAGFLALALCVATACGYSIGGGRTVLPPGAESVSIALFDNHTRERGLEVALRQAIEEEFRRHGPLRVLPEPHGDLVLRGAIRQLGHLPVASRGRDEAVELQERISVSVRLVERATGRVVTHASRLQEVTEFGVEPGAIITTSPRFQSEPVNARDIATLSNVPLGEGRRTTAQTELLGKLADDIYAVTMEGF